MVEAGLLPGFQVIINSQADVGTLPGSVGQQ